MECYSCGSSEAAREQLDRSEIDPRLAAAHRGFEVLGEPAVAVKPSKGSLDHPAPRQDREAGGVIGALDNLDPPLPVPGQCHCQLVTGVSAIREDMAQPRKQVADRGQQVRRSIPILSVGGMDLCRHQMSRRVGKDVALAAVDLLAGIIAARTPALRGLDRLAVDHASRRTGLASGPFARLLQQQKIDRFPHPRSLPSVEVALHRRAVWKSCGSRRQGEAVRNR